MKTVLFVDDDSTLLSTLLLAFTAYRSRFRFLTAQNGKEALTLLKSERIDIVITDLNMPEMDGFELVIWLRFHLPEIPFAVITAYLPEEAGCSLRQLTCNNLILKPFKFDVLLRTVCYLAETPAVPDSDPPVSINTFLDIVEMKQMTCTLEVFGDNKKRGRIFINEGKRYDAVSDTHAGESAFSEIQNWQNIRVNLSEKADA